MTDQPDAVLLEVAAGIAVLTINRPRRGTPSTARSHRASRARSANSTTARTSPSSILTGAGGTFSAGMDLKGFLSGDNPMAGGRGFGGITERPPAKPIIAAVEGYALAGGCELALACDLIVASEDAWFGLPEVTRGLVAGAGGLLRLQHRIPYHIAMEIALTGERIPAARLHERGPDQPARPGRGGPGRGARARRQDRRQRAARARRDQAHHRRVRRLARRACVRQAVRDRGARFRLQGCDRGGSRVRGEAAARLAR